VLCLLMPPKTSSSAPSKTSPKKMVPPPAMTADHEDYRQQLEELYRQHCPEKLRKIDTLLATYEGREKHLVNKVRTKYAKSEPSEQREDHQSSDMKGDSEEKENSSQSTNKEEDTPAVVEKEVTINSNTEQGDTNYNKDQEIGEGEDGAIGTPPPEKTEQVESELVDVVYPVKGSLYIDLKARISDTYGASLKAFRKMPDGGAAIAEAEGNVQLGDILMSMNGKDVEENLFVDIVQMVGNSDWPLTLSFRRPTQNELHGNRRKIDRLSSFASAAEAFVFNTGRSSGSDGDLFQGIVIGDQMQKAVEKYKGWSNEISTSMRHNMKMKMASFKRGSTEEQKELLAILENVNLQGGEFHTDLVVAKSSDRYVGGAEDTGKLSLSWYRALPGTNGKFMRIADLDGGFYQPSADDIGSMICLQCNLVSEPDLVNFAEIGPVQLEPSVEAKVDELVSLGEARFKVTLRTSPEEQHVLICDKQRVALCRLNNDISVPFSVAAAGAESSEPGETVEMEADFSVSTQLLLDPVNVCCFHMVFGTAATDDDGYVEGETEEDGPIAKRTHSCAAHVHTAQLLTDSPRTRDVITLTIRRLRASAVGEEAEEEAAAAELEKNLKQIELEDNEKAKGEEKNREDGSTGAARAIKARSASPSKGVTGEKVKKNSPSSTTDAPAADVDPAQAAAIAQGQLARSQLEADGLRRKLRGLADRWDESERGRQRIASEVGIMRTERDGLRASLKTSARRMRELEAALAQVKEHNARQESELAGAKAETVEVKMQLVEVSESCQVTASKLLACEEKVKAADTRYDSASKELSELRTMLRQSQDEDLAAEVAQLRQSEGEAKENLQSALTDLDETRTAHSKLGKQLHEMSRERSMMQAMIESRGKKLEEKGQRISHLEAELVGLKHDQEDPGNSAPAGLLKKELEEVQSNFKELEEKCEALSEEKKSANEAFQKAEADVQKAQESVSELTAQRNTLRRKAEGLAKDLKRLLQKGQALTFGGTVEGIEKCLDEHKRLQVEVKMHKGAHEAAIDELNEYKAALDGMVQKNKDGKDGKGKGATVMEKARLADRLMEKHAQLEERTSGLNDRLKDKEMTLDHQLSTNRLLVKKIEDLETQLQAATGTTPASSTMIFVGQDKYHISTDGGGMAGMKMSELPVSWLLSEAIRQHTEKHKMEDPGIIGLTNCKTSEELDLAANIGTCINPGENVRAILQ